MTKLLLPVFLILHLDSFAQRNPENLKGDSLIVKETELFKILGYEGFIKDPSKISKDYEFYLNGKADQNILLNNGKGQTPFEKLVGQKFYCNNVLSFVQGKHYFLELVHNELGTVYYKFTVGGPSSKYPFFEKEEYALYRKQKAYEAEKAKNAPPKDYCKILFFTPGSSLTKNLSPEARLKVGSSWDKIELYHSSEILPVVLHVQKGNEKDQAARFYSAEVEVKSKYDFKGEDVVLTLEDGNTISGKSFETRVDPIYASKDEFKFNHHGKITMSKEDFTKLTKSRITKIKFHLHENAVSDVNGNEIVEYAKCILKK